MGSRLRLSLLRVFRRLLKQRLVVRPVYYRWSKYVGWQTAWPMLQYLFFDEECLREEVFAMRVQLVSVYMTQLAH